jgi:hypothetical protein
MENSGFLPEDEIIEKVLAYKILEKAADEIEELERLYNSRCIRGTSSLMFSDSDKRSLMQEKERIIRELPGKLKSMALDFEDIENTVAVIYQYIRRLDDIRKSGRLAAPSIDYIGHTHDPEQKSVFRILAEKNTPQPEADS